MGWIFGQGSLLRNCHVFGGVHDWKVVVSGKRGWRMWVGGVRMYGMYSSNGYLECNTTLSDVYGRVLGTTVLVRSRPTITSATYREIFISGHRGFAADLVKQCPKGYANALDFTNDCRALQLQPPLYRSSKIFRTIFGPRQ